MDMLPGLGPGDSLAVPSTLSDTQGSVEAKARVTGWPRTAGLPRTAVMGARKPLGVWRGTPRSPLGVCAAVSHSSATGADCPAPCPALLR